MSRAPQEMIRVRSDLLDALVNFAGEVSIYRSRLEQQIGTFRFNLIELDTDQERYWSCVKALSGDRYTTKNRTGPEPLVRLRRRGRVEFPLSNAAASEAKKSLDNSGDRRPERAVRTKLPRYSVNPS